MAATECLPPPISPLVAEAANLRTAGNDRFKQGDLLAALGFYERALKVLAGERLSEAGTAKAVLWCNIAQVRLSQQLYERAVEAATRCLQLDSRSSKGLHRRSVAHEHLGNLEDALADSAKLRRLGDGHLGARESEAEEARRERLWHELQQQNRDIDKVAEGSATLLDMRERFARLAERHDLDDGRFFLLVARWTVLDDGASARTAARSARHWDMPLADAEFCVRWVQMGLEAKAADPEVRSIVEAARAEKGRLGAAAAGVADEEVLAAKARPEFLAAPMAAQRTGLTGLRPQ